YVRKCTLADRRTASGRKDRVVGTQFPHGQNRHHRSNDGTHAAPMVRNGIRFGWDDDLSRRIHRSTYFPPPASISCATHTGRYPRTLPTRTGHSTTVSAHAN